MTPEQKNAQREALKQKEKQYRSEYNYNGLIDVYDETIKLGTAYGTTGRVLFKKMYCLARLKRIDEVNMIMEKEKGILHFSMDQNELYRAVTLLSFFTTGQHTIFVIKQTLLDWLNDPETSKEVKDIVFDYEAVLSDLAKLTDAFKGIV
jgi:hypothetical protein